MKDTTKTTITIKTTHLAYIKEACLNLSKFVQQAIDKKMQNDKE